MSPPPIVGVIEMAATQLEDAGTRPVAAAAYELLAEPDVYDWPDGGVGGPAGGVGLLAVPVVQKAAAGAGDVTTEIAVANLAQAPGATDFALFIFDANGLADTVCSTLYARHVEYIDAATWGPLAPGFTGTVVISAVAWHHPVTRPDGTTVDQLGLGAVVAQRTGTVRGEDIPGDELGLSVAQPVRADFAAVAALFGVAVTCPGPALTPPPATRVPGPSPTPPATVPPRATATPMRPDPTATPLPPTMRPPPSATPPEGTPTAAPTATPLIRTTPTTSATASPAPSATPAAAGLGIEVKACPGLDRRVPAAVLQARLAQPETLGGWGERCNPALPVGPFNGYRTSLRLQNPSRPYQPLFNDLVLRCGCR